VERGVEVYKAHVHAKGSEVAIRGAENNKQEDEKDHPAKQPEARPIEFGAVDAAFEAEQKPNHETSGARRAAGPAIGRNERRSGSKCHRMEAASPPVRGRVREGVCEFSACGGTPPPTPPRKGKGVEAAVPNPAAAR